jgi:hypothetical protein
MLFYNLLYWREFGYLEKQIHEPSEENGARNHREKEENKVFDLVFLFFPTYKGKNDAYKECIDDHRKQMAF